MTVLSMMSAPASLAGPPDVRRGHGSSNGRGPGTPMFPTSSATKSKPSSSASSSSSPSSLVVVTEMTTTRAFRPEMRRFGSGLRPVLPPALLLALGLLLQSPPPSSSYFASASPVVVAAPAPGPAPGGRLGLKLAFAGLFLSSSPSPSSPSSGEPSSARCGVQSGGPSGVFVAAEAVSERFASGDLPADEPQGRFQRGRGRQQRPNDEPQQQQLGQVRQVQRGPGSALPEGASFELSRRQLEQDQDQDQDEPQQQQQGRPSALLGPVTSSEVPPSDGASSASTSRFGQGPDASSSPELSHPESSESTAEGLLQAAAGRALADGTTAEEEGSGRPRRRLNTQGACLDSTSLIFAVDAWYSNQASANATYGPIAQWNTSCATAFDQLFHYKFSFNDDISGWDTSGVTTMRSMFNSAFFFNQPIGDWDTSAVTTMRDMFIGASAFNQPIGGWDTSKVTTMHSMFAFVPAFDQPIGGWDTSKVTTMYKMFYEAEAFDQPIGGWDTSSVSSVSMFDMFYGATSFNMSHVCEWADNRTLPFINLGKAVSCPCGEDTYNPTQSICCTNSSTAAEFLVGEDDSCLSLLGACLDSTSLKTAVNLWVSNQATANATYGPIAQWNTSCATSFDGLFYDSSGKFGSFNADISGWDTSHVTNMYGMFRKATSFNQPIDRWDTSKVTSMEWMFAWAGAFNQPIGSWDTSSVTTMRLMFRHATSFNQPIDRWDTSKDTSMEWTFAWAAAFNQPIGSWDTSSVTTMYTMFYEASAFNQPIGGWDTSRVTSTHGMFYGASSFDQPIGSWDVGSVWTMYTMFDNANSFNISHVCEWGDNIYLPTNLRDSSNNPIYLPENLKDANGNMIDSCSCGGDTYNPTLKICCTNSSTEFLVGGGDLCPAPPPTPEPTSSPTGEPAAAEQDAAGGQSSGQSPSMPSQTFANLTSFDVDSNNDAVLKYDFTPGWEKLYKFYSPRNETGRPCLQVFPDDVPQVGAEFLTHESGGDATSVLGGLRERVARLVTVVAQNLTRSDIWFPAVADDDSAGTVEFCAVAQLVAAVEGAGDVVVGYVVDKIELAVDLSNSTFTLTAGAVAQAVANSTAELNNLYKVYAYLCAGTLSNAAGKYDNTSAPQEAVRANSKPSICIAPDSKSVQITSLQITEATNGAGESLINYLRVNAPFSPATELVEVVKKDVNNGNGGDAYTSDGRKVVEISVYALSLMFAGENPSLTLGGTAGLSFFANPNGGDRRLGEEETRDASFQLRGLQGAGEDAGTAGLSLEIALAPKETDMVDENVEHHELFHKEGHTEEEEDTKTSAAFEKKSYLGLVAVLVGAGATFFF